MCGGGQRERGRGRGRQAESSQPPKTSAWVGPCFDEAFLCLDLVLLPLLLKPLYLSLLQHDSALRLSSTLTMWLGWSPQRLPLAGFRPDLTSFTAFLRTLIYKASLKLLELCRPPEPFVVILPHTCICAHRSLYCGIHNV